MTSLQFIFYGVTVGLSELMIIFLAIFVLALILRNIMIRPPRTKN